MLTILCAISISIISLVNINCSDELIEISDEPADSLSYNLIWEKPIHEDLSPIDPFFLTTLENDLVLYERDVINTIPTRSELVSLDPSNGNKVWCWNDDMSIRSLGNIPVYYNDKLFISSIERYYSMSLSTGTTLWSISLEGEMFDELYNLFDLDNEALVGILRFGSPSFNNQIVTVDKSTGQLTELFEISHDNDGFSKRVAFAKPFIKSNGDSCLVMGIVKSKNSPFEMKSEITAYNLETNTFEWTVKDFDPFGGITGRNAAIIEDGRIYMQGINALICLNADTGEIIWHQTYPWNMQFSENFIVEGGKFISSTSEGMVVVLDKITGEELFAIDYGAYVYTINFFEDRLYFCNGKLMIVDPENGEIYHELETKNKNLDQAAFRNKVAIDTTNRVMFVQDGYYIQAIEIPD